MAIRRFRRSVLGLLCAALLAMAPGGAVAEVEPTDAANPEHSEANAKSPGEDVQTEVDAQLAERRAAMLREAQQAIEETHAALEALEAKDREAALEALARATGKLELLVARDPELALAPVDVTYATYDLYASSATIRAARDRAEALLEEGRVQQARNLLQGLASEIVIQVTNLPLATYPDAIKAISPLIDAGEIEEAKAALNVALGTLVVESHVISLPVIRARTALEEAEAVLVVGEPSDEDRARVSELVGVARDQIDMAEALGYGRARDFVAYRDQIDELERKIRKEEETTGVFAKLRTTLDGLRSSFAE